MTRIGADGLMMFGGEIDKGWSFTDKARSNLSTQGLKLEVGRRKDPTAISCW
jgi:hypothetical protein